MFRIYPIYCGRWHGIQATNTRLVLCSAKMLSCGEVWLAITYVGAFIFSQADRDKADAAARAQHEAEKAAKVAAAAADAAAAAEGQYQAELVAKRAALAPEPAANDPEAVTVLVRLPTGQRLPRRCALLGAFDFTPV